jgi:hypothetical protein
MSGLTGYLLSDGITDLSMVFMPLNNTFSGTNTFNGVVSLAKPTTLLTGSNPTTILSQIGGTTIIYPASETTIYQNNNGVKNLVSLSLDVGTYILTGWMKFYTFSHSTLNGYYIQFNNASAVVATAAPYTGSKACGIDGKAAGGNSVTVTTGVVNLQTSMTINLASATTIYLNYIMNIGNSTATCKANGQMNVSRIA